MQVNIMDPARLALAAEYAYYNGLREPGAVEVPSRDGDEGVRDHLSKATLWRLMRQQLTRVESAVLNTLWVFCSVRDRSDLAAAVTEAVLSTEAREVFENTHESWISDRFARYVRLLGDRVVLSADYAEVVGHRHPSVRDERFDQDVALGPVRGLWAVRVRERNAALRRVRSDCRVLVERFARDMRRAGHDLLRIDLSIYRAVEPLLEHPESGCLERGIDEFDPGELREYLAAALQAERILLRRAPDAARIHALLRIPGATPELAPRRSRAKRAPRKR